MARLGAAAALAIATLLAPGTVHGDPGSQKSSSSAAAAHPVAKVALVPLSAVAGEAAASLRKTEATVGRGIAGVYGATLISPKALRQKARQAGKARLLSCTDDEKCLRALGELAGAHYVVRGEVGGLGNAQVVYLEAVDVRHKSPPRSTTLPLSGASAEAEALAAATRLLAPARYTGELSLAIDIDGAAVFIDGQRLALSPLSAPLSLEVGSHALRVTHPEYRDYVRFVEVAFRDRQHLEVGLQQFPVVASSAVGGGVDTVTLAGKPQDPERPWYREWYTIAGASAAVILTTAIVAGFVADGVDSDSERTVR